MTSLKFLSMPRAVAPILVLPLLFGCAGHRPISHLESTQVQLGQANFRIVATGILGEATFIKKIQGLPPTVPYRDAADALWKNFAKNYGDPQARNLALVNVVFEETTYPLSAEVETVSVREDVLEFNK